ncbi:MAG: amino acid ABC transporter permease [Polynucleobacter sp.]|nr:amino acid ABC transporter permease [Polynucleobacter sp.]MDZ4057274.1 amino acid ABC transporter permease [Polynucleobacter sp.]
MTFFDILSQLSQGIAYTVLVTLVCSATGVVVGLSIAGLRRLSIWGLRPALDAFTYVFRGVPVLVMLFLVYFGLPSIGITVSPLVAMVCSLGFIAGAYLSEVFRGALDSVDPAEILAAEAIGMSRWQILVYIELPQMVRFAVPGMVNEFTSVLKSSPFAYTVGIPEITKQAMTLTATTLRGIEVYLAVGILYFAIYRLFLFAIERIQNRYRVPGMA